MSVKSWKVDLPLDISEFCHGISNLRQEFTEALASSEVVSVPDKWAWSGQKPVINELEPALDTILAHKLFKQLLKLLTSVKPVWTEELNKLGDIEETEFVRLLNMALVGYTEDIYETANRLDISPAVVHFALNHTLKPFFTVYSATVRPFMELDKWLKDFCPVCGNKTDTARIDGEEGKRHLFCGQCNTEWLFKLLSCPWCGNEDHRSLAFLHIEDTPGCSLHVCEQCRGYVKVIDERKGGRREILESEATHLFLDIIAHQQGFFPKHH